MAEKPSPKMNSPAPMTKVPRPGKKAPLHFRAEEKGTSVLARQGLDWG